MRLPPLDAGELNRRLTIERGEATADGSDRSWYPVRTVWANIRALTAFERQDSDILTNSMATHIARIRYVAGLDYGDYRFVYRMGAIGRPIDGSPSIPRDIVYKIDGITDPGLEHRELLIYVHSNDVSS